MKIARMLLLIGAAWIGGCARKSPCDEAPCAAGEVCVVPACCTACVTMPDGGSCPDNTSPGTCPGGTTMSCVGPTCTPAPPRCVPAPSGCAALENGPACGAAGGTCVADPGGGPDDLVCIGCQ